MHRGVIIKQISNDYTVKSDSLYVCKPRGKFRKINITPLVGDEVMFENGYIYEVLPRKNELYRPSISNVDQAIIITSLKQPDFSSNLLDKFLSVAEFNRVKPIIIFTKSDLLDKIEYDKLKLLWSLRGKEKSNSDFFWINVSRESLERHCIKEGENNA